MFNLFCGLPRLLLLLLLLLVFSGLVGRSLMVISISALYLIFKDTHMICLRLIRFGGPKINARHTLAVVKHRLIWAHCVGGE